MQIYKHTLFYILTFYKHFDSLYLQLVQIIYYIHNNCKNKTLYKKFVIPFCRYILTFRSLFSNFVANLKVK